MRPITLTLFSTNKERRGGQVLVNPAAVGVVEAWRDGAWLLCDDGGR